MAYVEAHASLRDHLKTKKVARLLGVPKVQVIGHLLCLWWWCQEYAQDGNLDNYDDADISEAAEWPGDASAFVNALLTCGPKGGVGFLRSDGNGGRAINDWYEYGGKLFIEREQNRQRQRNKRGRHARVTRDSRVTTTDVTLIDQIRSEEIRSDPSTTSDDVVEDPSPLPPAAKQKAGTKAQPQPATVPAPVSTSTPDPAPTSQITKSKPRAAQAKDPSAQQAMFGALAEVCMVDPNLPGPAARAGKAAKELVAAGYTPEQVRNFKEWWYAVDFRGQRGGVPTPANVIDGIKQSMTPRVQIARPDPTPERSKQNGANQRLPQNPPAANGVGGVDAEHIARYKERYG